MFMEKGNKNKMVTGKEKEVKNKVGHFYPDTQVTVEAETKEEADKKAKQEGNK